VITREPSASVVPFDWSRVYARRLAITDLLVLVWVVFGVQIAYFGLDANNVAFSGRLNELRFSYYGFSIALIVAWMVMLKLFDTRDYRVLGGGSAEYRAIADSAARLFGLVAVVSYLFQIDIARGYILRVVLVGSPTTALHIARELARHPEEGYFVVGACVTSGTVGTMLPGTSIPILGDVSDALSSLDDAAADTVVITGSEQLGPQEIKTLSWGLEAGQRHLIVAPSLTDVGGPRIHTRPVAGLPLIHVETPRYAGSKLFTKRAFDILGSGALVIVLSPVLVVLALVVKLTSRGPVFYRQERVGLNGEHFDMLKFRSMRVDADAELSSLLAAQGTSGTPLFKVKDDPRVTSIGKLLRKHSLDEFPQLFNVLLGSMSLVGPRPQRDGEVALYDDAARRRLLLKPGMSGLWQVGGRSSLGWEDAIRLDLYYVENWSITGDVVILWRTIKAVLRPGNEAS